MIRRAMEMEHYLEYTDNEVWKVIQMELDRSIAMTAIKIKKFYKKTGRRPRVDGKMHVAFDKRKVECFNCHNTGHFARECKFKGSKEGNRQEAGRGQDFKPVRTEKEALMTIDEGQINWVEQTTDEELNHALMAFTVNNEVSMCSKLCLDSYNALQAKYDELQSEFGDQEAALVAHKLAVKKLESQLRASHKQQTSLTEKLNFQANQIFEKDEKLKKYRRIGMKAVKDKDALQKIVDSWFASSKNLWKLIDCGMSSTVKIGLGYGIQSNAEVLGYEEEISRGIFAFRETDAGYYDIPLYSRFKQVEYKGVPHPLSGDYTPREQRVNVNTGKQHVTSGSVHVYSGTQIKSGASRFNTGKQHVNSGSVHVNSGTQIKSGASRFNTGKQHVNSGSVHVNSGTQIKSGASRFNTGKQHVSSGRVNRPVSNNTSPKPSQVNLKSPKKCFSKQRSPVNRPFSRNTAHKSNKYAVKGKMGTAVKTSAGCVWRKIIPIFNTNSGPTPDLNHNDHPLKHMEHRGIFDSGCSGHMTGNRAHLEDYQELSKVGSVTFGGSKGSISGKGTIRLGNLVFDDVAFVKELGHFNLFSISQICDKKLNVLFTEKECFVVSSDFKMPDENQVLLKVPRQHNMYTFDMKNVDSSKAYTCLLAKASSNEAKLWHRRLGYKQEFSNARTPQQNGVAERMNRTLIEAARTMLESFDGKSDEGFLVGYSVNSYRNIGGCLNLGLSTVSYENYILDLMQNQANPAKVQKRSLTFDVQTEELKKNSLLVSSSFRKAADSGNTMKELDALALKHLGPVPTSVPTSTNC
ncbi:ribonuclease H-like domain-containing protein [Tanacetum coccineum]